jgi:YidC/Oxa1 family membrane protein insertase
MGWIMNGIFFVIDLIGIPNIGLAIILFTIVANLLMTPLTINQQKMAKLSAKLNPEIQAIQAKYKGRKDNESNIAQNQEIQAVYAKYGMSPVGGCLPLMIQMPIIFALYNVIQSIPAYVSKVKEVFFPLVDKLIATPGAMEYVRGFGSGRYSKLFDSARFVEGTDPEYVKNVIVDCLNKASTTDFATLTEKLPQLTQDIQATASQLREYNNFLGLNIGDSPMLIMTNSYQTGQWLMLIGALMIPLLSALTQIINVKLMPSNNRGTTDDRANSMASSMKMMNKVMPIMSAVFCLSLPAGMGVYWITGSVIRGIQQVVINRWMDRVNLDELIKKNSVKSAKKLKKLEEQRERMSRYANMNTRNLQSNANMGANNTPSNTQSKISTTDAPTATTAPPPNSIMAKANMVKDFNERSGKKSNE